LAVANFKSQMDTPRAAYIHVPFCAHRCGYCNFTLVAGRDDLIDDYLRAIKWELQQLGEPHEVDTLFFGGGTPTHLDDEQLARLFGLVRQWFPIADGGEFSVEANPIHWNPNVLHKHGVTRVSLGGQSFDAAKLRTLERDHTPGEFVEAIQAGKDCLASTSADLIFGVPGETLDVWRADLQSVIELVPQHVSTYGLTFERGTSFWTRREHGELQSLDEELERTMYAQAIDMLTNAGYEHYEVSNFAQPGHRCRHNEAYWAGDGYYAIGPGAARYVGGRRESNHRSVTTYLHRVLGGQSPVAESEELEPEDRAREMLVFGLRRMQGVSRDEFLARTGFEVDQLGGDALRRFVDQGLLAEDNNTVRLTREGLFISDALWPSFLRR
jgi:oxygen-independent coproporphyrinogen-3 oxidase